MTDERSSNDEVGNETDDERAARLAALLSVDIGYPARPADDVAGAGDTSFRAFPATHVEETVEEEDEPASAPRPAGAAAVVADPVDRAVEPSDGARWRTALSFAVLAVLLLAGAGLVFAGAEVLRDSTEGEVVSQVDDPSAPGFEALVEATPTMVLFHDTGDGLDAITVLTLPDPDGQGGGVVLVPRRTVVDLPIFGEEPVEIAYDLGDPRVGTEGVGLLLGTAIGQRLVLDDQRWADLVDPVAPIVIDNPNELEIDGMVFPLGQIELAAEEVGPYLRAAGEEESDLARLFRHELFWEAWLDAIAEEGSLAAVPGEVDSGIGRFVRTIASGDALVETLPVEPAAPDRFGEEPAFLLDPDAAAGLLETLVPFPASPAPGLRARVRVLNGTTEVSKAAAAARELRPADVEIVLVGNAVELGQEQTTVAYFGDEFRDEAEEVVDLLGVGRAIEDRRPSDAVDITVTLGADYE